MARRAAAPLQGPRRGCPTGVAGDGLPLGHGRCHSGDLGADAGRTPACTALGLCRLAPHSVSAPAQLLATPALTYLSQAPSVGKGTLWSRLCAAWPHLSPQRARTLTADSYLCHVYCEQSKLVGPVSDAFCAVPSVACLTCCCTGGQARPQRGNLDVQCCARQHAWLCNIRAISNASYHIHLITHISASCFRVHPCAGLHSMPLEHGSSL